MVLDRFSLDGETAIVTGASRGIGECIANTFAQCGVNVVICSRSLERISPVAESINQTDLDSRAVAVECDITNRNDVSNMVDVCGEEFGEIDVLVNNAGGSFQANIEDISDNGWQSVQDTNLYGTFLCSQIAGESMKSSGGGAIVNISSYVGEFGLPGFSHYGAAKAGVINFTSTLAVEWAEHDIRVNCIAPGMIATPGYSDLSDNDPADIDRTHIQRRLGKPAEIADIAVFFASTASSFITGQTLIAQGPQPLEAFVGG